jgi:hypothetical protein
MTSGGPEMYLLIAGRPLRALSRQQHLSPSPFPV